MKKGRRANSKVTERQTMQHSVAFLKMCTDISTQTVTLHFVGKPCAQHATKQSASKDLMPCKYNHIQDFSLTVMTNLNP